MVLSAEGMWASFCKKLTGQIYVSVSGFYCEMSEEVELCRAAFVTLKSVIDFGLYCWYESNLSKYSWQKTHFKRIYWTKLAQKHREILQTLTAKNTLIQTGKRCFYVFFVFTIHWIYFGLNVGEIKSENRNNRERGTQGWI